MARVLVTEKIAQPGLDELAAAGHEVDVQLGLSPEELLGAIVGAHALELEPACLLALLLPSQLEEEFLLLRVCGRPRSGLHLARRNASHLGSNSPRTSRTVTALLINSPY